MASRADLIARAVLDQFETLPPKRKPAKRGHDLHEWVPLSGIVAESEGKLTCIALATGMKCLPSSKLSQANGVALHDWHAEILAIRTFNRFLIDECQKVLQGDFCSDIVRKTVPDEATRPFQIHEQITLHMYCSEAPCGDASMELTMAVQDDAVPWDEPTTLDDSLPGRAYFSQLGAVRRKPARGDAPLTLSKSCSDKLALKQCTSLLSSLTSLFIDPTNAYINTLVLPRSRYSEEGCRRAFSKYGRLSPLGDQYSTGTYAFVPFSVEPTEVEFRFSKTAVQARSQRLSPSNLAAAWSCSGFEESIIGGIIQGRKQGDIQGASRMSRRRMWLAAKELASKLDAEDIHHHLNVSTYRDVKTGLLSAERRQMKAGVCKTALEGWVKNEGDSDFSIDELP